MTIKFTKERTPMTTDILGIDTVETYKMPILHPATGLAITDKSGHDLYVEVRWMNGDVGADFVQRNQRKRDRLSPQVANSQDFLQSSYNRLLAALTVDWYIVNLKTGEELSFSEEAAYDLYADVKNKFIKDQVSAAVAEAANFFPAS